jgi:ferredoxin
LFDPGYAVPVTVLIFFLLPLVAALLFGRTFCAAVCPLGAIQDLVVIKPLKLPAWLSAVLGFFPYIYLALSILFAATASSFIICRYDPFISLFRLQGSMAMIVLGICFLLLGTVIARPYCRFSCPYGVLLNWLSRLSRRHMTITPGECIQCRLCADSCPFDAIRVPSAVPAAARRMKARKLLLLLVILFPFMLGLGGLVGYGLAPMLSRVHPVVRLAEQVTREDTGRTKLVTTESTAFRASGKTKKSLYNEVNTIQGQYVIGSTVTGVFLGCVAACMLIGLSVFRSRTVFEPDKGACISCGRCFAYCPVKPDTDITNPDILQSTPG